MLCMHVRARLFISATETQAVVAYKKFIQSQSSCFYCKILTELAMYWQLPCVGKFFFVICCHCQWFNSIQSFLQFFRFCFFYWVFVSFFNIHCFFFGFFLVYSLLAPTHFFRLSSQRASTSQPTSSHLRRCFT